MGTSFLSLPELGRGTAYYTDGEKLLRGLPDPLPTPTPSKAGPGVDVGCRKCPFFYGPCCDGKDLGKQTGPLTAVHLGHRGKAWSDDTSQLGPDKHARDVPSLDKYAEERWEVRSGLLGASTVRLLPLGAEELSSVLLFLQGGEQQASVGLRCPGDPSLLTLFHL